jgi:hypothetical protein
VKGSARVQGRSASLAPWGWDGAGIRAGGSFRRLVAGSGFALQWRIGCKFSWARECSGRHPRQSWGERSDLPSHIDRLGRRGAPGAKGPPQSWASRPFFGWPFGLASFCACRAGATPRRAGCSRACRNTACIRHGFFFRGLWRPRHAKLLRIVDTGRRHRLPPSLKFSWGCLGE